MLNMAESRGKSSNKITKIHFVPTPNNLEDGSDTSSSSSTFDQPPSIKENSGKKRGRTMDHDILDLTGMLPNPNSRCLLDSSRRASLKDFLLTGLMQSLWSSRASIR